jgi:hypothetical protein
MAEMTTAEAGGTTGRYLVLLDDGATVAGAREMTRVAGIRAWNTADVGGPPAPDVDGLILHELGVAVVTADESQVQALARAVDEPGPIQLLEPERTVEAIDPSAPAPVAAQIDETTFTWGLQAVGAPNSTATGEGIRVAVLDTGFDLQHPDFNGRNVVSMSFVQGEDVQDGHGHGTHCIGTSCGPREVPNGPAYGIAYKADIYAGKVLSNKGSGADGGILQGISWAISNGCSVVSMSLGAPVQPGQAFSRLFEQVALRALSKGTLIIAAAGNESKRPVDHGGRRDRRELRDRLVLLRNGGSQLLCGHHRTRCGHPLELADAVAQQDNQRNQHGHPACRRVRGVDRPGHRRARFRAVGAARADREAAAVAVHRCRVWRGTGSLTRQGGAHGRLGKTGQRGRLRGR